MYSDRPSSSKIKEMQEPPKRSAPCPLIGEIERTPAPSPDHQFVVQRLLFMLHKAAGSRFAILQAPCDLILGSSRVRQPDLMLIANQRKSIIHTMGVAGPPDLIVEVLTRTSEQLDRVVKMRQYAQFGVPEYWIVDSRRDRLEQYLLNQETTGYHLANAYLSNDQVTSGQIGTHLFRVNEILPIR